MNMVEWILCSDRLPNDSRAYLCYCVDYRYGFGRYIKEDDDEEYHWIIGNYINEDVIAWADFNRCEIIG